MSFEELSPAQRAESVKAFARQAGFDLVGIAPAEPMRYADVFEAWLAAGKHGDMAYMAQDLPHRLNVRTKFPWARSLVCVALSYGPRGPQPTERNIARYAWGRDYHAVMDVKLRRLERLLKAQCKTKIECRTYSDATVLHEREFAARAGIGWVGKHTLILHPRHGSYFLLGELVTSLELAPDAPIGDHCGTCTRCIDACPTVAITPYAVDATRCISYLTIEHKAEIAPEFHAPMREAGYMIGCDICQDVCPYNRRPMPATDHDLAPDAPLAHVDPQAATHMKDDAWDAVTRTRAHRRVKLPQWQRNGAILNPR